MFTWFVYLAREDQHGVNVRFGLDFLILAVDGSCNLVNLRGVYIHICSWC